MNDLIENVSDLNLNWPDRVSLLIKSIEYVLNSFNSFEEQEDIKKILKTIKAYLADNSIHTKQNLRKMTFDFFEKSAFLKGKIYNVCIATTYAAYAVCDAIPRDSFIKMAACYVNTLQPKG